MDDTIALTQMLNAAQDGDDDALSEAFAKVYPTLRRISRARRRGWFGAQTLDTTALVHEAYLKLARAQGFRFKSRGHFYATVSKVMRQALITYAERAGAAKRGGGVPDATLDDAVPGAGGETWAELISVDRALRELEQLRPRQARVVESLFFAGLGIEETADALEISAATVKRDWAAARAWLYAVLQDD